MTPFPRPDWESLRTYDPGRAPVEVDLSDNTNLWGPHPSALARLRAVEADDLRCYPEVYAESLRAAVGARFSVAPECVTTGAGSDDVLDSAFRSAAGPGEIVAYPAPTFTMIGDLARMNGMRPWPVTWERALEDPESLLVERPAVVYVCRPDNPTGGLAPDAWMERLLAAREPDGPLIVVDEAYGDFAGVTLAARAAGEPKLLVTRTCSKAFGLAGLRCGFGVAAPEVALEIEKSRGPYKVPRLTAEAAIAALRDEDGWIARTTAECVANRERLRAELEARGLRALESWTNFLLVRAPSGSAAADANALRERGVQVRPFTGVPWIGEGLRVTVGPWPLVERFLEATDALLAALGEAART